METIKNEIEQILATNLPGFYTKVIERKHFDKTPFLAIVIACNDSNINNVQGQHPQRVNLILDINDLELNTTVFGGMGGGSIYRNIRKEDPKEKYLAMKSIKIPFRRPQKNKKAILKAIDTFAKRYKETLKDNVEELRYTDLVNYNELLK